MDCPVCECEMRYDDTYGSFTNMQRGIHGFYFPEGKQAGYIYQCNNEECEAFQEYYHTDKRGDLHEGYPC